MFQLFLEFTAGTPSPERLPQVAFQPYFERFMGSYKYSLLYRPWGGFLFFLVGFKGVVSRDFFQMVFRAILGESGVEACWWLRMQ